MKMCSNKNVQKHGRWNEHGGACALQMTISQIEHRHIILGTYKRGAPMWPALDMELFEGENCAGRLLGIVPRCNPDSLRAEFPFELNLLGPLRTFSLR